MKQIDFSSAVERLRQSGFDLYPERPHIQIPDARELLKQGLQFFLGDKARWLPCYDEVAAWLTDNKGRGLLCVGNCGLGKTLLCSNVIPVILHQHDRKIISNYSAIELNEFDVDSKGKAHPKYDKIASKALICIDDIGTESDANVFGDHHCYFSELVDAAEKKGKLLIITTNLRTSHKVGPDGTTLPSIEDRYGIRTLDRLKAITKVVKFEGRSFRK